VNSLAWLNVLSDINRRIYAFNCAAVASRESDCFFSISCTRISNVSHSHDVNVDMRRATLRNGAITQMSAVPNQKASSRSSQPWRRICWTGRFAAARLVAVVILTAFTLLYTNLHKDNATHAIHRLSRDSDRRIIVKRVFVANLSRRPDRWRGISSELRSLSNALQIERLDAVDGHHGGLNFAQMVVDGQLRHRAFETVINTQRRTWGQDVTRGSVGCFLSHAKAWERASTLNQSILVLEDDVSIAAPANFRHHLTLALQELPPNFGLMYLADMAQDNATIHKSRYSAHLTRISRPLWGTYAYVISPVAARRLLFHMYPIGMQVDSYIKQVAEVYGKNDMPNFVASHDLVSTDNSETRDTDTQVVGEKSSRKATSILSYHVLMTPEEANVVRHSAAAPHKRLLTTMLPGMAVAYHTEQSAAEYAVDLGLLNASDKLCPQLRRWLLCVAVSITQGGGLCFTEPAYIARSIHHLLGGDTEFAVFMTKNISSKTPSRPERNHVGDIDILPSVVFARSVLSATQARRIASAVLAHHRQTGKHDCSQALAVPRQIVESIFLSNNKDATAAIFPPHLFDPLLPMQRPCRCTADDWRALSSSEQSPIACQSRCDRMVVPVYAAGYINMTTSASSSSVSMKTSKHLHILISDHVSATRMLS
jgi:GR25 family glycosyltransferase involved in LPS biosynthesis